MAFREATSKKELCQETRRVPLVAEDKELEDFENRCLKSQSNNIFICPKKIRQRKRNKLIEFVNRKMSTHKCCRAKKKSRKRKRKRRRKNGRDYGYDLDDVDDVDEENSTMEWDTGIYH